MKSVTVHTTELVLDALVPPSLIATQVFDVWSALEAEKAFNDDTLRLTDSESSLAASSCKIRVFDEL